MQIHQSSLLLFAEIISFPEQKKAHDFMSLLTRNASKCPAIAEIHAETEACVTSGRLDSLFRTRYFRLK
jgi:uncharacterized protein YcsI (UPF0317 family)